MTIDEGKISATFTVPITNNNIVEGNETFTVTLSESDTTDLPDGVTIRDATATGTITETTRQCWALPVGLLLSKKKARPSPCRSRFSAPERAAQRFP